MHAPHILLHHTTFTSLPYLSAARITTHLISSCCIYHPPYTIPHHTTPHTYHSAAVVQSSASVEIIRLRHKGLTWIRLQVYLLSIVIGHNLQGRETRPSTWCVRAGSTYEQDQISVRGTCFPAENPPCTLRILLILASVTIPIHEMNCQTQVGNAGRLHRS